jgi:hypothetical protein
MNRSTSHIVEIVKWRQYIDGMTWDEAAYFWRFAPQVHPIIQTPELWKYFSNRFRKMGGYSHPLLGNHETSTI